ncbi:hypothetical protein [Blastopirellula marina]|uniref:Metallopeptidase n=1 Tax=Blastopirellula marina TaxID=124 RepID=A0A2S8FHQ3_9BACT|nr:hypothetical protein [Blastopirellula marina]PQO31692.1 hypothetical protein C5Y98_19965 [Blastopirellula marina]PTL42999.1 hypothetical protein C5Y97_19975 [Blastopirellula marina]
MHWFVVLTALVGAEAAETASAKPDSVSAYHLTNVRGWDVYVHKTLLREDKETGDAALELLDHQLYGIIRCVPKPALTELQKIPIWLEQNNTQDNPCACYHPDVGWLKENGYLAEKEKCVEIASAKTFLDWTHRQPFMLLHELAHGYHDRVLGFEDARVIEAYKKAKKAGGYEEVLHINGEKRKHYALENEKEYFAEATEAFFGANDFYPFNNAELKQHDPEGYRLIESLWKRTSPADEEEAEAASS